MKIQNHKHHFLIILINLKAFFGLLYGADNISKTAPFLECFSAARGAAAAIFKVIDRVPKIDAMSVDGTTITNSIRGNIKFKNVSFSYPSRPAVQVLL